MIGTKIRFICEHTHNPFVGDIIEKFIENSTHFFLIEIDVSHSFNINTYQDTLIDVSPVTYCKVSNVKQIIN